MTTSLPQREQILDQEIRLMKTHLMMAGGGQSAGLQGGLIFTGNVHDTVPRQLLLSDDIGPREKITWQLIRLYAPGNQAAVFPSYTELQYQLAAAEKERASRDSVSQAIRILRMERWLSLVDTVRLRDKKTGRLIACRNIYALHDEPLPFEDAEQLDPSYMTLLEKCVSDKNSKAIRHVAGRQLRRIQLDTSMRHQHSRVAQIASRLAGRQTPADAVPENAWPRISQVHIPDSRTPDCGLRADIPATDRSPQSATDAKLLKTAAVRDPNTYVRRSFTENKKIRTYIQVRIQRTRCLPLWLSAFPCQTASR
ncbi:STY4528 family pathogenicity island replication protein [Klebsiella quasivariicola]|uniref:STY4528 family pathogenicity island replication protein n=1 Tax=Klebsiella quasivariicola TaxID=2026240 RepID=UPI002478DA07|nr:STY4528 family pathogenicity island replication protein [Klebsiella quasivariicola]